MPNKPVPKDSKLGKHVEQLAEDTRRRLARNMPKALLKSGYLNDLIGAAKYDALRTSSLEDAEKAFMSGLAAKADSFRKADESKYMDWANARSELNRMDQAVRRTDEAQTRKQLWGKGAPTPGAPTEDQIAEADEALGRHLYKPAYTSHGDALSGAVEEWVPDFLSFGALPMSIAASIGEYALDQPESSPMTEATDAWKRVLGASALPRAPGEYDLTEMGARVLSPLNFVGAGTMAKASKMGETLSRSMPDAKQMAKVGGLGALAYGSDDAEAAPFRFLTPERLAKLVNQYGYSMNDKAKGALAHVSAESWLRAHTPGSAYLEQIRREAGKFDPARFAAEDQYPFSMVDHDARVLTGHEGRHRLAAALAENGQDFQIPMVMSSWQGQTPDKWENFSGVISGQPFGKGGQGTRLFVPPPVPLNYQFGDDLKRFLEPGLGQRFAKGGLARLAQRLSATSEPKNLARPTIIKEKGGNWLKDSIEDALFEYKYFPEPESMGGPIDPLPEHLEALNFFVDKRLTPYVRNEMATQGDSLRALAEQGIGHMKWDPLESMAVARKRVKTGYPRGGVAESYMGQGWEEAADEAINVNTAGKFVDLGTNPKSHLPAGQNKAAARTLEMNPWLKKVDPKTPVYSVNPLHNDYVDFRHLMDELENAASPYSNLPGRLRLSGEQLKNLRMDEAAKHVHEMRLWRESQKREADKLRANNPATHIFKEYPEEGYSWVELKAPKGLTVEQTANYSVTPDGPGFKVRYPEGGSSKRFYTPEEASQHIDKVAGRNMLQDALNYEGTLMKNCVGKYCEPVMSGESKIFSLRDKEGLPFVTVEVQPPYLTAYQNFHNKAIKKMGNEEAGKFQINFSDWYDKQPEAKKSALSYGMTNQELTDKLFRRYMKEIGQEVEEPPASILQIRGIGENQSIPPEHEFVKPFIHDFVKSGKWGEVRDLKNAGLHYLPDERFLKGTEVPVTIPKGYHSQDDLRGILKNAGVPENEVDKWLKAEGFAEGGLVEDDGEGLEDFLELATKHYRKFAAGGLVQDDPNGVTDDIMENLLDIAAAKYSQMAPRPAV